MGLAGSGAAQRCRHRPGVAPGGAGQHLEGGLEVGDPPRHGALDGRELDADREVERRAGRGWDVPKGGLQHADPAALGRPAQRSEPIVAQPQRTHAGGQGRGLAAAGGAGGSGAVPGVDGCSPQFAVGVPTQGEVGTVGAADGDRPGSPQPLHGGCVQRRICVHQGLDAQRSWRTDQVEVLLDGEGHAVERW